MKKKIVQDTFTKYRFLSDIKVSPNGKGLAFCVHQANLERNCYDSTVWYKEAGQIEYREITSGGKERSFTFYGNDAIVYPAMYAPLDLARAEAGELMTVFYKKDLSDGAETELFRVPLKNAKAQYLYDGKFVLSSFCDIARPDFESMDEAKKYAGLAEYAKESEWIVCDEAPFRRDGMGYVNKKRTRLFIYDISNEILTPLAKPIFDTLTYAVRADGRQIAYVGEAFERRMRRTKGIWLYDVENGSTKMILPDDAWQVSAAAFLGEDVIATAVEWDGYGNWPNHHLCRIHPESGQVEKLAVHMDEDCGCKTVSDSRYGASCMLCTNGNTVYYITSHDNTAHVSTWTESAGKQRETGPEFAAEDLAVSSNGVYCIGLVEGKMEEIYQIGPDGQTEQVSWFNEDFSNEYQVTAPVTYSITDRSGYRVDGFVVKPRDYEPGKKYPAILEIHGGPRMAFTPFYHHEIQMLSSAGYFVIYCNPRGSSSRGEEFADIALRHGEVDFEDIMEWTEKAIQNYQDIDLERIGVTGGSYGGFMTNWIITHTNFFKAAVSCRSISNIIGNFGTSDESPWSGEKSYGGTPYKNSEAMWRTSPLKYADQVKTPTLFLQSLADYRCCAPEAIQMYTALQYFGIETRMCLFKDEPHGLSRMGKPRNRYRRLNEILNWMNLHLKEG